MPVTTPSPRVYIKEFPSGVRTIIGVATLSISLNNPENIELNPLGINCLRNKLPAGMITVVSCSLVRNNRLASALKYIPVWRPTVYLKRALYRNAKWSVFESENEPFWVHLQLSISSFINNRFCKGKFQGSFPKTLTLSNATRKQ